MIQLIIWDLDNPNCFELKEIVKPTLLKYKKICNNNSLTEHSKVIDYLIKYTNFKGINKEIKMKDVKTFIIRLLTCACMLLIIGQTNFGESDLYINGSNTTSDSDNQIGRYQAFVDGVTNSQYLIDTTTGEAF